MWILTLDDLVLFLAQIKYFQVLTYNLQVTTDLFETSLSENLIHPTLLCRLFTLIYPTPGLSNTFYKEQTWSDKQGPTVLIGENVTAHLLRSSQGVFSN